MAYEWFKLRTDTLNDPKLRRYFPKEERWNWIALKCLAGSSKKRGIITLPDDEIAYALELTDEEWSDFEAKLALRGMVERREDDNALVLTQWEDEQHQYPSDKPEAVRERVKQHREKAKSNDPETPSNDNVTSMKRDVTSSNDTDKNRIDKNRIEHSNIGTPPIPDSHKALLSAFQLVRFPENPNIKDTHLRTHFEVLSNAVAEGVTPEMVTQATNAAMSNWSANVRSTMTIRGILGNLETLLKENPPPPPPAPKPEPKRYTPEEYDELIRKRDERLDQQRMSGTTKRRVQNAA